MTITNAVEAFDETTAYMFGRDSYYDGPCARSYDPWEHAKDLGLPVIYRELPSPDMVSCWSEPHRAIFVRHGLDVAVERCAIAHEIAHYEASDIGCDRRQERRADRVAARRLIRPSSVYYLADETSDLGVMALELSVTEHIMTVFMIEFADRG